MTKKNLVFVAVDAGSGNVALTFERDGKMFTQVTPALVRQGNQQTIASETSSSWITEGRNYAVVKQGTDLVDTCDPDYQVSAAHRVLVIDALTRAGLTDCDVVLAETLPVNQFYADKGVIDHARIDAKVKSLMTPVRNYNDAIAAPRIVHVEVFPEAIPAVVSAQADDPTLTEAQTMLVADLGRFTCDLAVVDSELQVVSRRTTENGVHVMINRMHELLQDFETTSASRLDAKNLSIESIDPIIRQGYIGSRLEAARDKRIDVTSLINRAAAELSETIRSDIRKMHRNLRDIDAILLVGGGANYIAGKIHGLDDHTAEWHDVVITPDNPEMSIVRGVYMALMASRDDIIAELNG